jgi:twitching motility protein PilT
MGVAAILAQSLLPGSDGRVPAGELLVVSYGARQHIRKNALQNLHQEMTSTRRLGSFTLEESLATLVRAGRLERQAASLRAAHPEELDLLLAGGAAPRA